MCVCVCVFCVVEQGDAFKAYICRHYLQGYIIFITDFEGL